jgi:peptidoglycan/LPS O-acetylase OafA/YrhL
LTTSRIAASARTPSRTAASPATHRPYFPALDGIRGVAFLMVFGTHYLQLPWGWTGVNVFFVLSGFLITGILYDTRDDPHRVKKFYVRRTLRIFPLYYGLMLLLVFLYPFFRWQWNWHWLLWPAYLGNMLRAVPPRGASFALLEFGQPLSRNFPRVLLSLGHFWSLCVEEQFYLLWPWVVFGIGRSSSAPEARRKLLRICVAGVIALPLLRILASHTLPPASIDNVALLTVTPLPFDALLLGAIVALLHRGPLAHLVLPGARSALAVTAIALTLVLVSSSSARHSALPTVYASHPHGTFTWGVSLINIIAACVIVMAMEPGSLTFRVFHLRPLRWLGRISYGAYVFHDILHGQIIRLVQHYTAHWVLPTAAAALASTLLLAWASFRWFETPFIRLKDRWTASPPLATLSPQQAQQEVPSELIHHPA